MAEDEHPDSATGNRPDRKDVLDGAVASEEDEDAQWQD